MSFPYSHRTSAGTETRRFFRNDTPMTTSNRPRVHPRSSRRQTCLYHVLRLVSRAASTGGSVLPLRVLSRRERYIRNKKDTELVKNSEQHNTAGDLTTIKSITMIKQSLSHKDTAQKHEHTNKQTYLRVPPRASAGSSAGVIRTKDRHDAAR